MTLRVPSKLLDEAGYPRGADGIRFTAEYLHRDVIDLGYTEIAAGYWSDIGVDVTTAYCRHRDYG